MTKKQHEKQKQICHHFAISRDEKIAEAVQAEGMDGNSACNCLMNIVSLVQKSLGLLVLQGREERRRGVGGREEVERSVEAGEERV